MRMHCSNCGYNFTEDFNKGESASGHNFLCPVCACCKARTQGLATTIKNRMSLKKDLSDAN